MAWQWYLLLGALVVLLLSTPLVIAHVRAYRLSQAGLSTMEYMTDEGMVTHLTRLFSAMGYRVRRPRPEEPQDFDILLTDGLDHHRGVVIRYWNKPVDEAQVKSAAAAKDSLLGEQGAPMIISLQYYTYKAKQAAESADVILWDLTDLTKAFNRVRSTALLYPDPPKKEQGPQLAAMAAAATQEEPSAGESAKDVLFARPMPVSRGRQRPKRLSKSRMGRATFVADEVPNCPKCGRRMMIRDAQYGEYWGCTAYPRCLGNRPKLD